MKNRQSKFQDEFMAAAVGDLEWLKQSLRDKVSYVDFDENGLSALHLASIHGRFECVKYLIEDLNVDVNLSSKNGWRPIHLCINNKIGKRSLQTLLYLIHKGADLSVRNDDGVTAVHQAANEGNLLCLNQLIEVGADFSSKDNRGNRPIDLAKMWGHKHCAKVLATHSWHQDKAKIFNEKYEMKKSEIREILSRIEQNLQIPEAKRFKGSQAFYTWLEENTGDKLKKTKRNNKEEEDQSKEIELKKYIEDVNKRKTKESIMNHPEIWKFADPNPRYFHKYPVNLRDLYPRHPYTLEPLHWSTPKDINPKTTDLVSRLLAEKNQTIIRRAAQETDTKEKKVQPKLVQPTNRQMYYSNDSVIDLPKKRVPASACLQKTNDSVFCLTNDVDSPLFKCALGFPIIEDFTSPSTASSDLSHFLKGSVNSRCHSIDVLSIES